MAILNLLFNALRLLLFVRIILSWLHYEYANEFTRTICRLIDPFLEPIQKILPANSMGIDFSPIILFIFIDVLQRLLITGL
ncbi:MAG: YggT family protein [Fibrobacterota bacterium]|jgi:YggT family protein